MTERSPKWAARLAPYMRPDNRRATFELALTITLFAGLWAGAWALSSVSYWLAAPVMLIASLMLVRLFILQHDCGHGSLFSSSAINDRVGRIIGIFTLTPYSYWRHSHNLHHASSGNLDKRGVGDIDTLTIEEYQARGFWGRLGYRAYRNPLVLFVIGPAFVFLIQYRLPFGFMDRGAGPWISTIATDLGIALLAGLILAVFGWKALLFLHLPIVLTSASIGVWLFYVQHQFDPTFWERAPKWEREKAALEGSSFYDLPKPLMWLTGNIGIHHVHHLAARVPFWRLPAVLKEYPEFGQTGRLTLWQSLKCVRLTLWDEVNKKLISFGDLRRTTAA